MRMADEVYTFWFVDHTSEDWFGGKPEFDLALDREFRATHEAVARGEAWTWRQTLKGRLCEIIVLDQFSRQLHRGSPRAFASDTMALALAQEMVTAGIDKQLTNAERAFVYLPYMHSESLLVHGEAMRLYTELGDEGSLKFEKLHIDLIERFGRYPKRNEALDRPSTPQELAYIEENQSGFF